jgi:hypothetical protein
MKNAGNIIKIQTISNNAKKIDLAVCAKDLGPATDGCLSKVLFKVMLVFSLLFMLLFLPVSSLAGVAVIYFREKF